ncbi:MAG TPA: adenylate/guanylate cyclase domain-containing protein [Anaeromyxobacteraceae bacterium]|nr:adenylate/guanylate cyclase domain-containing protein [Anaeromyxobacteraceae bacterium]
MAELFVVDGRFGGTVFLLSGERSVVGRSPECEVSISEPWISSRHAALEVRGDELWVVDLDSRNGTWLGEQRVREARLHDGDLLGFGRTTAKVRIPVKRPTPARVNATLMRRLVDPRAAAPAPAASGDASGQRQVAILHAIARALADASGLEDGLPRILEALSSSIRAERASVLLTNPAGEMETRCHLPPEVQPRHSASIIEAAVQARAGIVTVDAQADARFSGAGSIFAENIRSCLCVPIWAENRILGALVFDRRIVEPFTGDDLELATVAAYQLALAVERERFLEHSRTADQQRRRLLRHFSPDVAAAILQQEEQAEDPLAVQVLDGVTVLFSDVRGFTRMTELLPALELAGLLREYFHEMTLAVFEERGTLDKFIGDGLMAVFDAPVSHGDGALRAVRCAWLMQGRLADLNQRLPADRRIAIRVGVNTGRVIAGNLGSPERLEYTVLGDTVNVASRLESIAEPGTAFVGRATYDATRHAFRYRELGMRQVKGREVPVEAFQLLGPL